MYHHGTERMQSWESWWIGLLCISSNYSHITATHHLCFWTYLNTQPRLRRKNALMWCFWEQFFCMASFYWRGAGIIKLFIENLFFLGIDLWFGRKIISEANSILPSRFRVVLIPLHMTIYRNNYSWFHCTVLDLQQSQHELHLRTRQLSSRLEMQNPCFRAAFRRFLPPLRDHVL